MSEVREEYAAAVAAHRAGGCERCEALVACPEVWELLAAAEAAELAPARLAVEEA